MLGRTTSPTSVHARAVPRRGPTCWSGSDWDGQAQPGATEIRFPTRVGSVLGRWACSGVDDLPTVHALQDQLTIRPVGAAQTPEGVPETASGVPEPLLFFEQLRVWMKAFPPAPEDQEYQQRFAPLGLLDGSSPYSTLPTARVDELANGLAAARARLEAFTKSGTVQKVNGWMLGLHMFDYNLDYFGPGAINDPQWKKADRATAYPDARAFRPRRTLGNHAYEATYAQIFEDSDGEPLTGEHRYSIRFETPPPVEAFWSITMYDIPNYYLVDNPIDRYSIGDRTPGIQYDDDGSLTISMQHAAPDDDRQRAELASHPGRTVPSHHPPLRTRPGDLRWELPAPAHPSDPGVGRVQLHNERGHP